MRKLIAGLLIVCVFIGCATVANWGEMTPLEKAKFQIDATVVSANLVIENAKLFIEDTEDIEKVQAKINAVASTISLTLTAIMQLVPAENDAAMIYAEEAVIKIENKLAAFEAGNREEIDEE